MNALSIKQGSSAHSVYDLRSPFDDRQETHTLAILVDNEAGVLAASSASSLAAATTSTA